jgi:hypothetical protein
VFAGAAREAVFSQPEVIRRVNADFIPLAVRATMANLIDPAGDEAEGLLYARLKRTQAAPQGICVLNAGGQVLDWVLTFDNDRSVLEFLDYSLKRFHENPDAIRRIAARRYMRFPTDQMPDVADDSTPVPITAVHAPGLPCPAASRGKSSAPPGAIAAELVGRALDSAGGLSTDTVNQEHYAEDHFSIPADVQGSIAAALSGTRAGRVRLPDSFGQLCATYAYLGHIDVRPLDNPRRGSGELNRCEFWIERVSGKGPAHLEGQTEVTGDLAGGGGHSHQVRLSWEGFLDLDGNRITRLLLSAHGTERLKYGGAHPLAEPGRTLPEAAFLPGGRLVDLECGVRYGIIGTPVAVAVDAGSGRAAVSSRPHTDPPGPAPTPGRQLMEMLGPQFAVFLAPVQEDLKLSAEQKQHLQELMRGAQQGVQQFMQTIASLPPEEREKKHQEFRQEANKAIGQVLGELLNPEQQKRLRQIVLQQEGLFSLGNPEVAGELKLSDEQKSKFMAVIQETQKRFEALQRKAQMTGKPEEVQREASAIRKEQEGKIEALLTDAQRQQWKQTLGKPLAL